ncbi:unnamed protein product, partial [Dicrocoelium dendriticum]
MDVIGTFGKVLRGFHCRFLSEQELSPFLILVRIRAIMEAAESCKRKKHENGIKQHSCII